MEENYNVATLLLLLACDFSNLTKYTTSCTKKLSLSRSI